MSFSTSSFQLLFADPQSSSSSSSGSDLSDSESEGVCSSDPGVDKRLQELSQNDSYKQLAKESGRAASSKGSGGGSE